jgi:hypothetical protein
MKAEFEEKTYEDWFNSDLNQRTKSWISIGQVQEGKLGFDCSAFLGDKDLWEMFNKSLPLKGTDLINIATEMENRLSCTINKMPPMQTNLLFQYKRPEYITSYKCREWRNWEKPYFRYNINHKQQNLLMAIDKQFGNEVLIIYASPALYTINDLDNAHQNNQIIAVSNFCKISELDKHRKNTYIKAGTHSIACSKPKQISSTLTD